MDPEYAELIKSKIADVKNISGGRKAVLSPQLNSLEKFVEKTPGSQLDKPLRPTSLPRKL